MVALGYTFHDNVSVCDPAHPSETINNREVPAFLKLLHAQLTFHRGIMAMLNQIKERSISVKNIKFLDFLDAKVGVIFQDRKDKRCKGNLHPWVKYFIPVVRINWE